jgi:hypothetical protein
MKAASLSHLTVNTQLTAMQFNQALSDGQAKPSPFRLRSGTSETVESFKDSPLLFGGDTWAVILHFHANFAAIQVRG